MLVTLAPAVVIFALYGFALGPLAGLCAGALSLFSLFTLKVVTYPITVETLGQRLERERLLRDVAAIMLVAAVLGLGLASVLIER